MKFVIDCSFSCALFLPDENSTFVSNFFESLTKKEVILVPTLWWYEIANVLVMAVRRDRINHAQVTEIIELVDEFEITTKEISSFLSVKNIYEIAQIYRLSAYDAAYLSLAITEKAALATLDENLLKAAKKIGAEVYEKKG